ncbi:MAG: hypothetical protein FJX76_28340 [Armatimonadetes bacterium]|nr:hypothetical protein [Armatimonadota bacterium]
MRVLIAFLAFCLMLAPGLAQADCAGLTPQMPTDYNNPYRYFLTDCNVLKAEQNLLQSQVGPIGTIPPPSQQAAQVAAAKAKFWKAVAAQPLGQPHNLVSRYASLHYAYVTNEIPANEYLREKARLQAEYLSRLQLASNANLRAAMEKAQRLLGPEADLKLAAAQPNPSGAAAQWASWQTTAWSNLDSLAARYNRPRTELDTAPTPRDSKDVGAMRVRLSAAQAVLNATLAMQKDLRTQVIAPYSKISAQDRLRSNSLENAVETFSVVLQQLQDDCIAQKAAMGSALSGTR